MTSTIVSFCLFDLSAGFNNDYCNLSKDYKSIVYNGKSPLENYHASLILQILEIDEFNILKNLGNEDKAYIQETIVHSVLGTDMVFHF